MIKIEPELSLYLTNKIFKYGIMNIYDPKGDYDANIIKVKESEIDVSFTYSDKDNDNILEISVTNDAILISQTNYNVENSILFMMSDSITGKETNSLIEELRGYRNSIQYSYMNQPYLLI